MCFHSTFSFVNLIYDVLNDMAVTAVDLKQTVQVDKDLQIRAYYAGHVGILIPISRAIFNFQEFSLSLLITSISYFCESFT